MNNIILHIDMNSYFASVEQQANPFLRGRSVGVCAYLSPGGCIIASSIEAKAKGIKTGMRVSEAKLLDPDIVLLENEPAKYRSTTERIAAVLASYTDTIEPYSIDESFLDLTGWVSDFDGAARLATEIQERIRREAGEWLGSSVGVSWTRFLAKFAGDIAPKRGILLIRSQEELVSILSGRNLTEAWGIGPRMGPRLMALGIADLLALRQASPDFLRRHFGRYGYYLWANLNGIEVSGVAAGAPAPKSIGHSYCLPRWTRDKAYLGRILCKLCEKSGRRLRASGQEAGGLSLYLGYAGGDGLGKSWKLQSPVYASEEICALAEDYLGRTLLLQPVRMLAVSLQRLSPLSGQLSLFASRDRGRELSKAVDKLNDKYGEYTVIRGAMFGTNDMARDRVGFRKID